MKRIFLTVVILLMCGSAWGATYYVSTTGDNSDGLTPATAWNHVKSAIDYIRTNGPAGNTINIAAGNYNTSTDYMVIDNANHSNLTVIGENKDTTILNPGTGNHSVNGATADNVSITGLTLKASTSKTAVYKADGCDNWTLTGNVFEANSNHAGAHLVFLLGDKTDVKSNLFKSTYYSTGYFSMRLTGDSNGTVSGNMFVAAPFARATGSVSLNSTATINVDNNAILDTYNEGIQAATTGTYNIINNIIGGGVINGASYSVTCTAATHLQNNYLIANARYGAQWTTGSCVDDGGNIKTNADPKFTSHARKGYILPRVDDSVSWTYAKDVAAALAAYSVKGTYFLNQTQWDSGDTADLQAMVLTGAMSVGAHGYSHSDLNYSHGLNFSQTGGTTCTAAFDGTTITEDCDGSDYDNTYITTGKTLGEIITALNGVKGWTVAKSTTGSQSASNISGNIKASSFAVLTATAAPVDLDFNLQADLLAGYWKDEMADPKAWLTALINASGDITDPQTGSTYVCNSLGFPFNTYTAGAYAAARTAGFTNAGTNKTTGSESITAVTDADLYTVFSVGAELIVGADEATTRKNAAAFGFAVAHSGLIVDILSHATSAATMEEWGWMLDEWNKIDTAKLAVTSHQIMANEIRNSGLWTDDGDGTWSRVYNIADDLTLQSTSPLVIAGIPVDGVTYSGTAPLYDFTGTTYFNFYTPSIGAYSLLPALAISGGTAATPAYTVTGGTGQYTLTVAPALPDWVTGTASGDGNKTYTLSSTSLPLKIPRFSSVLTATDDNLSTTVTAPIKTPAGGGSSGLGLQLIRR